MTLSKDNACVLGTFIPLEMQFSSSVEICKILERRMGEK